ncbi:hypothetical protein [Metabacillus sp. Hm71]|uniref:hypothetical protein n=1 Tax=Metabacillus sp. Hm71 TaxID=3450743 RepID=UPI003F43A219
MTNEEVLEMLKDKDIDDPEFFKAIKFQMEQNLWNLRKKLSETKISNSEKELVKKITLAAFDNEIKQMEFMDDLMPPDQTEKDFKEYVLSYRERILELFQ